MEGDCNGVSIDIPRLRYMGGVEVCVGEYPRRRDRRRRCGDSGFCTAGHFPDLAEFFIDGHSCIGPISQANGGCFKILAERAGRELTDRSVYHRGAFNQVFAERCVSKSGQH